jgi:outer membrane beta-barrel protein
MAALPAALLAAALLGAPGALRAQANVQPPAAAPAAPANEQVIQPEVPRRDIKLPRIPSNDWVVGIFGGSYATENFGAHTVSGLRLGYHVTEDFFVEATYGQSEVSDSNFRQVLPGGIFPRETETLRYYALSAGVNVLPGEVFFGRNWAKVSALYLIAGIGSTRFLEQRKQTVNFGLGLRVFPKDWMALQVDMRNHVYTQDLLGRRQSTNNLELTAGLTLFF